MNFNSEASEGAAQRVELPAIVENGEAEACPVVRDGAFARLTPTSFSFWSPPDDPAGRVEIVFQRLMAREIAHRFGDGPVGRKPLLGKDVRMEVRELGSVELSRESLVRLRQEIDAFLGEHVRPDFGQDAVTRQLLASTRSELAGIQDQLTERMEGLAQKIDGLGEKTVSLRSQLAGDLEQLVRMLWPKSRDVK